MQNALIKRLNRRIKKLYCAFLTCDFVHNCPICSKRQVMLCLLS
ncbi:MAG: ribosomal protein S17E [Planktomarina sp.]